MKKFIFAILSVFAFISCSDKNMNYDFSFDKGINKKASLPVSEEELPLILSDVVNPIFDEEVNIDVLLNFQSESEAEQYMGDALVNSKNYLYQLGFTNQELIEEFGSIDNPRIISLGILVKTINTPLGGSSSSLNKALGCAWDATGISEIIPILVGQSTSYSFAARRVLIKTIGKVAARYALGYWGVALMVADFVSCMLEEDSPLDEEGSDTTGNHSNNPTLKFPEGYSGEYYYTVSPNYVYSYNEKYSSNIYVLNNKYYFNSSKTCLLPSGYYFNDLDNNIYQVVYGEVVSIQNKPAPPCATCPREEEYFYENPFDCNTTIDTP